MGMTRNRVDDAALTQVSADTSLTAILTIIDDGLDYDDDPSCTLLRRGTVGSGV